MRKYIVFVLLLSFVMVACAQLPGGDSGDSTESDTVQETADQEAPRVEVTATPSLPPTYTPEPMGRGGHISPVSTRTIHIVQAGETLGGIAAFYGLDTKFLADSNRIYNYNLIKVGQILYIPECE
ncbi:MAG: LysM peptidoglycan-binding domain-containing protein [Ardenticatenaceae bacterium]|nr:LysM peptidoglycan-binding domain-containing protein [Ardenticatenaceae bacterium]